MKKQLFTLALGVSSLAAFSQASTVWQPYNANVGPSGYIRDLSVVDTNTVWGIDGVYLNKFTRTIDGANYHAGSYLADTLTYAPSSICAIDANTAFIATYHKKANGAAGQVLKTTDGGTTWNNVATATMFNGTNNFPDWVHFWDANNGIVMGDPNGSVGGVLNTTDMFEIYRTHDGGTTWNRVDSASMAVPVTGEYGLVASYTTYKHFMWLGTTLGNIYASADSGKTWSLASTAGTGMSSGCNGLAFRDSIHGIAWGGDGAGNVVNDLLFGTADGGLTWNALVLDGTVGTDSYSRIPKTKGFMSVGLDVNQDTSLTSVTYDDGATWTVLEKGPATYTGSNYFNRAIRMLSVQMVDSLNGWAGNLADSTLPLGKQGMNRFHLGHKTTCDINITATSSSSAFNVCLDSMITMTASGLDTYTWSANAGSVTTASVSVTPTITTTYSVSGTTTTGCTNFASFDVTVVSYSITGTSTHSVCPGVSTPLKVNGATNYTWAPATALSSVTGASVTCTSTASITYTVSTTDLNNGCPINSKTIAMTIKPTPTVAVSAAATTFTLCTGATDILTAQAPAGSTYAWSANAGSVTTATASVAPTTTANTTYTVSVTDAALSNCVVKTPITITVAVCTGIEDYASTSNVSLYPNPSTGLVTITLSTVEAGTVMYVTNMIGQQVAKTTLKDLNTEFNFSTLEKGVYFVTVTNGNNKHVEKLIIQ